MGKGNRNYRIGYVLENWICKFLSYHGFHCKRNYGSKGVEDIIAIRKGIPPLFIQCKASRNSDKLNMTAEQIRIFREHAEQYGCIPVIVNSYRSHKYWYIFNGPPLPITPVPTKEFLKWSKKQKQEKAKRKIKSCNVCLPIRKAFIDPELFNHINE